MRHFAVILAFILSANLLHAQQEKPRYQIRLQHDPYGIGKFYLGREIAQVMGYEGAGWLERPEREREERVSKLMPSLGIKPGDFVADLGAGSGHHTIKLSSLVGSKGKVYAVDIQTQMLDLIRARMRKQKEYLELPGDPVSGTIDVIGKQLRMESVDNVIPIHNTEQDPKLPAGKLDMILMVDVYHELSYPYEVTVELVKALKPGGRLVFVEYRLEDRKVPILDVHRMSIKQVTKEMEPHNVKHLKTLNHLPWQHVIIFEKLQAKKEK